MEQLVNKNFQIRIDKNNPILRDHKVDSISILPGVVYLDFIYRVLENAKYEVSNFRIRHITFKQPLRLINDFDRVLTMKLNRSENGMSVTIESCIPNDEDNSIKHFEAEIIARSFEPLPDLDLEELQLNKIGSIPLTEIYSIAEKFKIQHGNYMRAQGFLHKTKDKVFAELTVSELHGANNRYVANPCLMDAATLVGLVTFDVSKLSKPLLPIVIEEFTMGIPLPRKIFVVAKRLDEEIIKVKDIVTNSIEIYDEFGVSIATIKNLKGKIIRNQIDFNGKKQEINIIPQNIENGHITLDLIKRDFIKLLHVSYKIPIDNLKSDVGFYDLGLDSNALMSIGEALESKVQTKIYPTLLFEYPTIGELVDYLYDNYKEQYILDIELPIIKAPKPIDVEKNIEFTKNNQTLVTDSDSDNFAIVGLQGRFPQSENMNQFWENLEKGKNCIESIPLNRWDHTEFYSNQRKNIYKTNSQSGGFVKDIDLFDPLFFKLSGREAERIDPQERCFLEMAYATMDDAGYTGSKYKSLMNEHENKIGVFVGVMWNTYGWNALEQSVGKNYEISSPFTFSIANRVSHFFDFKGPSYVVDSACSSSLLAIHRACEEIKSGSCKWALAGGVNLATHPSKYVFLSQFGMISPGDKNYSFSEHADGYVPGEGVGCILIKSLTDAIKQGDHIYGVIKGSAVNHGGKSAGYSVPNPNAQEAVIRESLAKANVLPEQISYIEAHGTGTSLGDPIEINALLKVFKDRANPLLVGSVKSNIGHLESASGIAGVAKVLQQFKHGKIAPSIHADQLNKQIDFGNNDIEIATKLQNWQPSLNPKGELSRIAGVSSFGAGGTNVHVILEQAPEKKPFLQNQTKEEIFVLSAKNYRTLEKYLDTIISHIRLEKNTINFNDVIYTLQQGRKAMNCRLAIVCSNLTELISASEVFLNGQISANIFTGESLSTSNEDIGNEIKTLARSWVNGQDVDWSEKECTNGLTVSLPPYPFDRKPYWINVAEQSFKQSENASNPFACKNVSTVENVVFEFNFSGKENVIGHHKFQGNSVFPGAGYIAMAIQAGKQALGIEVFPMVKNVKLVRSLTLVGSPFCLRVFIKELDGIVSFSISDSLDEKIVYCKGKLLKSNVTKTQISKNEVSFDLSLNSKEVYQSFFDNGMQYGSSFQLIEQLSGTKLEARGRVRIPLELIKENRTNPFIPQLLDVALQTTLGVDFLQNSGGVPVGFDSVELFNDPTEENTIVVQKKAELNKKQFYDISIFNIHNEIVLHIVGYECLIIDKKNLTDKQNKIISEHNDVVYFNQNWEKYKLTENSVSGNLVIFVPSIENTKVINSDTLPLEQQIIVKHQDNYEEKSSREFGLNFHEPADFDRLFKQLVLLGIEINGIISISKVDDDSSTAEQAIDQCSIEELVWNSTFGLRLCQAINRNRVKTCKNLLWVGSTSSNYAEPMQEAMMGMFRSFEIELPGIFFRGLWIDNLRSDGISIRQAENVIKSEAKYIKIKSGVSFAPRIVEDNFSSKTSERIVEKGIYLITGGTGGIGKLIALFLAEKYQAKLILVGRKLITSEINVFLELIESLGGEATYYSCDISRTQDLKEVINEVEKRYQKINGIIHSAGLVKDSMLTKKEPEDMSKVFEPKVQGLLNLDQLTKHLNIDWLVLCSSVSGVFGNIGQADYAVANCFMDNFALSRNIAQSEGKRNGTTISINWPYWKEGGMRISSQQSDRLERIIGMKPLETLEGIGVFLDALKMNIPHTIVFKGDKLIYLENVISRFQSFNLEKQFDNELYKHASVVEPDSNKRLLKDLKIRLNSILAAALKVELDDIDYDTVLEEYGLDSILMTQILDEMELELGFTIEPGALLENPTINLFADYLLENYREICFTSENENQKERKEKISAIEDDALNSGDKESEDDEYAVVAMASRFPKSPNIEKYWENLCKGDSLVDKIGDDRMDIDEFFDPKVQTHGKSYSKWAGMIEGVDLFDNGFFNISEDDALVMDPQQRILMELTQHLFDHGGFNMDELNNQNVGVFIGGGANNYYENAEAFLTPEQSKKLVINKIPSMISARLSSYYNLKGPALTIDTACSSSLVALHQACKSLKENECKMAIAGGVFLPIDKHLMISFSNSKVLAKDGKCKVFDKSADGIVLGEGAGLVMIKRLKEAINDGDQIFGVIKGSAVNNDGKTMGITAPNMKAQEDVIREAIKDAKIIPSTIGYLEAHGTGTLLGDPIEIKAAANVYGEHTDEKGFCKVGSVKSNMGHLLTAAGVSGVIKVLLSLHHKIIVPTLNCDLPHPRFGFGKNPFELSRELQPWKEKNHPRRAAISSFGFSGTNCHVILEEMDSSYKPSRQSLDLTKFDRKRFWLGKTVVHSSEIEVENILNGIFSGKLSEEDALEKINELM
ncbi:SDR family NAD(P)-dependent oxidoreductase [Flavobacterium sp. ANB]|uniref:SDR family NAD(P)-dependent oxidoreductase n=1 Tax=unclassified Flavobacterium TaxID=196869 RepID=UPI0012B6EE3F|nr:MULTISPECIES: SDR family NAD(P)-dependent oxidoreductase [unclassified Flavobacterium]MBF4518992.1 SDR family NAD(P)-dependent oxidoreductase [Flavobacterium sp. ANB]MTD71594.1 SDR family NAD(P)-dependent oxidoreductase [Flavobacterium sp. LC2016-13]